MERYVGAIEAGGTKFNCAVVGADLEIVSEIRIPTITPAETLGCVVEFFRTSQVAIDAIGVSSFGPLDLNRSSPQYGHITTTPKLAWRNADLLGPLRQFGVPVAFDTDVNGAAYGEFKFGAAKGLDTFVYYTIGTGIGGGGMIGGKLMHGLTHPEMGHMMLPHDRVGDPFAGCCPSHGDCFEGLASGPALAQRWSSDPTGFDIDHPAWQLEAHYIALALANTVSVLSPQRIVLGGGVMQNEFLFPLIRSKLVQILNGYVQHPTILEDINSFVVPPGLGASSGVLGAAALAFDAVVVGGSQ
jgi:fructokinase